MRHNSIRENRLLKRLTREGVAALGPFERVQLAARAVLLEPGTPPLHAYFPLTAVISLVSTMESGESAEVALVGSEGLIGLTAALRRVPSPTAAVVQVAGSALRVSSAAL